MITFKGIGIEGRLSNQIFQIASTIGIAKANNHKYIFPKWQYSDYFKNPIPQDEKIYELECKLEYLEGYFHYSPIIIEAPDNGNLINLSGYFQSYKYWIDNEDVVRYHFELTDEFKQVIQTKYNKLSNGQKTVSLHVRRGDYLLFAAHHPVLPLNYYQQAVEMFPDYRVVVFSDDIEWCKRNFKFQNHTEFSENNSDLEDLFLQSFCDANIIANSSFSWWGAYLGDLYENKKIVSPIHSKWFGSAYSHNTSDLLPNHWIQMKF